MLVHGIVIGSAVWWGQSRRVAPTISESTPAILELIAAPASEPASASANPPAPAPTPPPEEILPQTTSEPVSETVPAPVPLPPVETIVEPPPTAASASPSLATTTTPVPANISGDNSSLIPGKDHTTIAGNSLILAEPNALNQAEPEYPLAARRRGQEGTVLIKVTVNVQGEATAVVVLESSGHELLDQAAVKFARTWKFTPARLGATPVESNVERPVRFKLNR